MRIIDNYENRLRFINHEWVQEKLKELGYYLPWGFYYEQWNDPFLKKYFYYNIEFVETKLLKIGDKQWASLQTCNYYNCTNIEPVEPIRWFKHEEELKGAWGKVEGVRWAQYSRIKDRKYTCFFTDQQAYENYLKIADDFQIVQHHQYDFIKKIRTRPIIGFNEVKFENLYLTQNYEVIENDVFDKLIAFCDLYKITLDHVKKDWIYYRAISSKGEIVYDGNKWRFK